jgi:hypothetical protein
VPRIPVYEARVGTAPLSPPRAIAPAPTGIAQLGAGIAQAGSAIGRMVEEERQKAEAVQITNFETGNEQDWTELFHDDKAGLRSKVGESAFTTGADAKTLAEMGKRAQARLKAVPSERAREVAALRLQGWMASREREVEGFVSQQRRAAEVSAVEARKVAGLDAAARSYADPKALEESIVPVETSIRALSPSAEAAEVEVRQYRAVVVGSAIDAALARRYGDVPAPDVTAARGVLEAHREAIGPAAAGKLQAKIDGAGRDTEAESIAANAVEFATDEEGRVNESQALAILDTVKDTALKDESTRRVKERLTLAEGAWNQRKDARFKEAFSAYLTGGLRSIPSDTKAWLIKNYPEGWDRLRGEAEQRYRQSKGDAAAVRREQSEANRIARNDYLARPAAERAGLDIDATYGGTGPDAIGLGNLRVLQRQATDTVQRGEAVSEDSFRRDAVSQIGPLLGTGPQAKKKLARLQAEATARFNDFLRDNKRKPNGEETLAIIDDLGRVSLEEHWYGDRETFGFEAGPETRAERRDAPPPATSPAPDLAAEFRRRYGREPTAADLARLSAFAGSR